MKEKCRPCAQIEAYENDLDALAKRLDARVNELCRPIREANNARWRTFAAWCRLPLIGRLYQRMRKAPTLESEPDFYEEPWYRDLGGTIQSRARVLEAMKKAHLLHWAEELVMPAGYGDPGGYYTPDYASRARCYDMGLSPFVPDKYDYASAAGFDKHHQDSLVMCSKMRQIVPIADCDMTVGVATAWKPIYYRR